MGDEFDLTGMYARTYPDEPDWRADEQTLYAETRETLDRFRSEQSGTVISSLIFHTEPINGYVSIALDTPERALQYGQERHQYEIGIRPRMLSRPDAWTSARYYLERNQPSEYEDGDPTFSDYGGAEFPKWYDFSCRDDYPILDETRQTDFLEGHCRLIFWQVIERLIADNALAGLHLASPFRLGYAFHDSEEGIVVVRMINWPQTIKSS